MNPYITAKVWERLFKIHIHSVIIFSLGFVYIYYVRLCPRYKTVYCRQCAAQDHVTLQ